MRPRKVGCNPRKIQRCYKQRKKTAWTEINAMSFTKRTVEELKKVGLKHVAKKGASEVQKERIKTGDGKLEVET
mgnify:CR=1 FL=1